MELEVPDCDRRRQHRNDHSSYDIALPPLFWLGLLRFFFGFSTFAGPYQHLVSMDRLCDVLDGFVSNIFKPRIQPTLDVFIRTTGYANASGVGQTLQPSSYVYTVPVDSPSVL